jgi:O-antigen/teichoic acid export membrane protein
LKQTGLLVGSTLFFLASLIIFVTRFAASIIVARTLGVEGKGIYTLVLTISSLLVMFLDFGLASALTYLVASGQYPPRQILSFALWTTLFIWIAGSIGFYALYTLSLSQTFLAGVPPVYIQWVLIFLPINILTSLYLAIILGLQNIFAYNLVNISRAVLNLIFLLLSSSLRLGITGAIWSWLIANLCACLLVLWFLRKDIGLIPHAPRKILESSLHYGIKSYPANIFTLFTYRLDTFFVNFYSGASSVGLYSTGVSSAELLWYVPNAISSALFPKSATLDKDVGAQLTARVCRQTLFLMIPLAIFFGIIGRILIPLFFGLNFIGSVIPFLLLLPGIVGMVLSKIIFANLSGSGRPQFATYSSIVTFAVTVGLDILLIPIYDIAGAAIASTIAYLLGSFLSVFWFSRQSKIRWHQIIVPTGRDALDVWNQFVSFSQKLKSRITLRT